MTLKFSCFVTGTDTGVGKTLLSAALLHALRRQGFTSVAGMKPVAAGAVMVNGEWFNEDVAMLAGQSTAAVSRELTTPYLLKEAAAPHIAASLEHVEIESSVLLNAYQQLAQLTEAIVVEGVGGFRVPLNDGFDTADLAVELGLDIIMVVGLRLGCINHALLTAEAIASRGLKIAGWIANQIDVDMPHQKANVQALQQRLSAPLIGVVPWMAVPSVEKAVECLDLTGLSLA